MWQYWHREKGLGAEQEKDHAACKGTESHGLGGTGVRFLRKGLGVSADP